MEKYDRKLVVAAVLIAGILLFGTVFFHIVEGWRFIDAFYFSGVTLTTVGYGDFTPHTDFGKFATVIFAFAGISIVFYSIGIIAQRYFEREEQRLQQMWEATTPHRRLMMSAGVKPLAKQFNRVASRMNETLTGRKPKAEFRPLDEDMRWWLNLQKHKRMPPPKR